MKYPMYNNLTSHVHRDVTHGTLHIFAASPNSLNPGIPCIGFSPKTGAEAYECASFLPEAQNWEDWKEKHAVLLPDEHEIADNLHTLWEALTAFEIVYK